jgi:hypothetical protein
VISSGSLILARNTLLHGVCQLVSYKVGRKLVTLSVRIDAAIETFISRSCTYYGYVIKLKKF